MANIIAPNDFRVIASGGAGRTASATAHSVAVFRGAIYLGSSCGNVAGADDAPRILRYNPGAREWETVYESPLIDAGIRAHVPDRQIMSHFQSRGLGQRRRRVQCSLGAGASSVVSNPHVNGH